MTQASSVAADLRALSDEIEGIEGELGRGAQREHGDIAERADRLADRLRQAVRGRVSRPPSRPPLWISADGLCAAW
ncbi:ElaB/YqjD/DUF883 family membrane-anchored ribosome-binding protein [Sphingomonas jinjuensis]|uniref:ElaB/YqjD/DUF883 family membrane-anchored ribosome-binding protein n=1 Tax=Sphingomonas jinjuensis TaxID=535907 RepID=A0A840FBJ8_9SPHN|nr:hypothetical protein [Sphingomonas jinjuensis]MBB4152917.1 ElaB/YqjD/DUF883 family membrane-anchored ribosome-binding protein [Sphingomonas jinjuensis]